MGTNYTDFILEANRTIKKKGKLFVAEISSRIDDINKFVALMKNEGGFKSIKVSKLKDYFYVMIFEKENSVKQDQNGKHGKHISHISDEFKEILKPCKYKRR